MEYKTECAITGKTNDLTMHALRNDNESIIGWVFLNEEVSKNISDYEVELKTKATIKKNKILINKKNENSKSNKAL